MFHSLCERAAARWAAARLRCLWRRRAALCVAPLVFRAPDGPAAREARRPHFVRRRASKPARALRTLRRPPHRRRLWCCVVPARPRHRPRAPRQVPPAPFTPVGPGVLIGCSARRPVVRPGPATASSISHAIPSDVFHGLKCDRWNSADSALVWGRAELELHAELREFPCPWSSLLLRGALLG